MNSGVAKAIRSKWPEAYEAYMKMGSEMKLGGLSWATIACQDTGLQKTIFNAITQEFYGRDGKQYVSYEAVKDCMERVNFLAAQHNFIPHVAMPKIGAGLGGGDWEIIAKIIEEASAHFQPVVYELP